LANTDPSAAVTGRVEDKATFRIVREDAASESCTRRLLFPDHHEIQLRVDKISITEADPCRMADVATDSATSTVTRGPIPRRSDPVNPLSLIKKDACDAGKSAQFPSGLPGVDPAKPDLVGYGNWRCTWGSETGPVMVWVEFGRRETFDETKGQRIQIGTQPAVIDPPDEDDQDTASGRTTAGSAGTRALSCTWPTSGGCGPPASCRCGCPSPGCCSTRTTRFRWPPATSRCSWAAPAVGST
jgi:hypothetical protein